MQVLGTVENISHKGALIVRGEFAPLEGSPVFDNKRAKIGRVTRVFGPVSGPYVSVKPVEGMKGELLSLLGKQVHVQQKGTR